MTPFKRRRRGGICAVFEWGEAQMLANLTGQVVELLRDRNGLTESDADPLFAGVGLTGPISAPEDPVLLRLLPDAYGDDLEDSAEFRRFTEESLTSSKVANAESLIESLADGGLVFGENNEDESEQQIEVELDHEAVQAWLKSLTDVRLALGIRIGIESDEDANLAEHAKDESVVALAEIYDWLGYVQESLIQSLD